MLNLLITDALGNQTFSKQEEVMPKTSGPIHDFSCQLVLASLPALGGNRISRARTKLPAAVQRAAPARTPGD